MTTTVNMHDAKAQLAKLIEALENGAESEIGIARDGRPAVKLVPVGEAAKRERELAFLAGKYSLIDLDPSLFMDADIASMFLGEGK